MCESSKAFGQVMLHSERTKLQQGLSCSVTYMYIMLTRVHVIVSGHVQRTFMKKTVCERVCVHHFVSRGHQHHFMRY